ncbi:MAG TPA: DUF3300 domain-containing protein [Verrucomicrobiae bacterium]|nr:DUF3300 domain-containing protein [Verrucomicrobiae bacterium]
MARGSSRRTLRSFLAALCCALVFSPGELVLLAQENKSPNPPVTEDKTPPPPPSGDKAPAQQSATGAQAAPAAAADQPVKLTNDQLDSLVAPIALYPDALLAQVLVASTYPLELVQLQQWMAKNKELKDKALADAVAKQPWDASIQSMAAIPDVVKRLCDDIQWTTDLGNAFLAQQADVMEAAQRMRKKAQDKGALKSNEQQKVTEKKEGDPPQTIIVVESANPEVVYVPSYSPTVVYGAPIYPYPPIYYPPYPPGAAFVSFSFGVMWGAAIWGGSCCGCGWGGGDVDINVNNNFNKNEINTGGNRGQGGQGTGNRGQGTGGASAGTSDRGGGAGNRGGAGANNKGGGAGGGGQKWSHNPSHRGGAPYGDKATANKYGGNARGDSLQSRQSKAGGAGAASNNRAGGAGGSGNLGGGAGGGLGGGPSAGTRDAAGRGGSGGAGGDRIGNQSIGSGGSSRGGSSSRGGGFGSGGGYSGAGARANSSRGASSMGGRSFGGGGGGGRRR